jgi:hypothetical protein
MAKILTLPKRTFNTHDASVTKGDRTTITIDMVQRMGLVVRRLASMGKVRSAEHMAEQLNKHLHTTTYTANDMVHVFRQLAKANIVEFAGSWRLTRHGATIWQNAQKIRLNK